jgi:malonyl CoA-acyl carrier protein transacylase
MKAYIFPGQGAQFYRNGKGIVLTLQIAKELFHQANEI